MTTTKKTAIQIKNMRCRRCTTSASSEQENEDPKKLAAALWPTTIGIVVWSSIEESFGSVSTCLRVEIKNCVPI